MGLLIGLIILGFIWISSMPASNCLREGKEFYRASRQKDKEYWRNEAQKHDCYYDPVIGSMNDKFYGDGSVKVDVTTGHRYEKGQYYCRADGVNAGYHMADSNTVRPPKQ